MDRTLPGCNGGFGPRAEAVSGYCWAPVLRNGMEPVMRPFVHEFAHAIDEHKYALDPTYRPRLLEAFENAKELGTWYTTDLFRGSDFEYWATAVTA